MREEVDRIRVEFDLAVEPDVPMASNPLKVVDMLSQVRGEIIENREELADDVVGQINIYSHAGTGWLLWNHVAGDLNIGPSLDWLVGSHQLLRSARSDDQQAPARRRLLGALGTVHIGPGTVLQDQDLKNHGYGGVPKEVAKEVMLTALIDWLNLQNGVNLVAHTTVHVAEKHKHAGVAQQNQQVGQEIRRAAEELEFTFDPATWAWWRDDHSEQLPVTDAPEVVAILPTGYGEVNGAGHAFEVVHADVKTPHVLKFRRVDDAWLEAVRHEAVEHIDQRIRAGDNSIAAEWENQCRRFGASDPVRRWEKYRKNWVDPALE
jgi:hypothetical protein